MLLAAAFDLVIAACDILQTTSWALAIRSLYVRSAAAAVTYQAAAAKLVARPERNQVCWHAGQGSAGVEDAAR